ncbi:MAG: phosphatase PAP2 family protein [Ruminococcaceae bacterium]|nr:phosphatase PAP2 family protein [Oscillospiraceae bacterium]
MLFGTEAAELWILNLIQDIFGCGFLDFLMPKITALGNAGIIWILVGLVLLCTKKYRRGGVFLLVGLLLGLIFGNVILKNLIARPRPCWIYDVPLLIPNPTDFSFPSGHTLSSFISAFVLMRINRKFGIPALVLAILIAFSRMYLFVHFPTDILGGIVLAYAIYMMIRKYIDPA